MGAAEGGDKRGLHLKDKTLRNDGVTLIVDKSHSKGVYIVG